MKREFKVALNTGSSEIREAEAFRDGMKSIYNDSGVVPYCSEILVTYFQIGRKCMIDKVRENTSLKDEIISIECSIEGGDYYWCVAIVEVEERKLVDDVAVIECPFSSELAIDSFCDGVVREKSKHPYYEARQDFDPFAFNCGRASVRYVLNSVILIQIGKGTNGYEERTIEVK